MVKQLSSTDDILDKLPAISRSVRNKTALRVADGERIVFSERHTVIDSQSNVLKRLGNEALPAIAPKLIRKRAA